MSPFLSINLSLFAKVSGLSSGDINSAIFLQ